MTPKKIPYFIIGLLFLVAISSAVAMGQAQQRQPTPNDTLVSPEVQGDKRVTFRIYAPKAAEVALRGDWMEGPGTVKLEKDDKGVWSATVGPLVPDFYSYSFIVDGVRTLDPKNAMIKQGVTSLDNMFLLPGAEAAFEDNQAVPHGEIRKVWYQSSTLGMQRRCHIYFPPGYESGTERYPVFYLLHGGGDEDSGWSTIGRAGFILDNLIAAKKARPMIVVMPNGSLPRPTNLPPATPGAPPDPAVTAALQERFTNELLKEVVPFVEKNYRVLTGRDNRAIAGLSMGGGQTTRVVIANPDQFAYVAVWSAGVNPQLNADFEQRNAAFLSSAEKLNQQIKLFSISVGDKDFALAGSKNLAELLKKHGIKHELHISGGGHTWINWRHYLNELAPRLFQTSTNLAQTAAPAAQPTPPPVVTSPEVLPDRQITFRLLAPQAESVRITGSDIPGMGQGKPMAKGDKGIWEITIGPIAPGSYRYNFNVNGVPVIDPRNPSVSESNNNVWSLVHVPGSEFSDTKNVPHGAVAAVTYYSTALGKFRRLHVYTPPGYESGHGKFPVFFLLHGASDSDNSWSSVGRAGFILDNLIAAKKARPMIIVMPAGHTRPFGRGPLPGIAQPGSSAPPPPDEFIQDFMTDIMPVIEKNYRVLPGRENRAIAGLSMGGNQTLNIALPNLEKFGYVGVFSSGLLNVFARQAPGAGGPPATNAPAQITPAGEAWIKQHQARLNDSNLKKGLKLLWIGIGKDDFLLNSSRSTVELLKKHGFTPVYRETEGGHTWINWRNYLNEFAPQLFQSKTSM